MMLLLRLIVNAAIILVIAHYLPGFEVSGFMAAFIFAIILGLFNALLRPILVLVTLPISIISLGLFILVINTFIFWLAGVFSFGIHITGFFPAFWGAILVWLGNVVVDTLVGNDKYPPRVSHVQKGAS